MIKGTMGPKVMLMVVLCFAASIVGATDSAVTADTALDRPKAESTRYIEGRATHEGQDAQRRAETTMRQHPYAVVLACADSRVGPEIVFDEGIGDLFVIRNAGNLVDPHVLGRIGYAVEHLHTPLVDALGHGKCGAGPILDAAVKAGHLRVIAARYDLGTGEVEFFE